MIVKKDEAWQQYGFYYFCLFYGLQRGTWEFIKPYEAIFLNLNIFHFLCLFLIIYSLYMTKRQQRLLT